jgi:hypothetical protein
MVWDIDSCFPANSASQANSVWELVFLPQFLRNISPSISQGGRRFPSAQIESRQGRLRRSRKQEDRKKMLPHFPLEKSLMDCRVSRRDVF